MKILTSMVLFGIAASASAQSIFIKDFGNWEMNDVATKGLSKEKLFKDMNRELIKVGASICSNRALVWAYDFKRRYDINAGKLFLFYTKKSGEVGRKTWWYHVTPVINEKGNVFTMDAGFPGAIVSPLTANEWLKKFSGSSNCKEIQGNENDLIERMFQGYTYPQTTSYGTYDCYYKFTPGGYWTPSSVAMGLLGVNAEGQPVRYVRDEIEKDEVYAACVEAVTKPVGRALGNGKKKCEKYLDM